MNPLDLIKRVLVKPFRRIDSLAAAPQVAASREVASRRAASRALRQALSAVTLENKRENARTVLRILAEAEEEHGGESRSAKQAQTAVVGAPRPPRPRPRPGLCLWPRSPRPRASQSPCWPVKAPAGQSKPLLASQSPCWPVKAPAGQSKPRATDSPGPLEARLAWAPLQCGPLERCARTPADRRAAPPAGRAVRGDRAAGPAPHQAAGRLPGRLPAFRRLQPFGGRPPHVHPAGGQPAGAAAAAQERVRL